MNRRVLIVLCILISYTVHAQNTVQEALDTYKDSVSNYGIVALLCEGDKITTGAIGYADSGVVMTKDHLFCIGSVTKTFTSAAIFRLQEQGKLNINDAIVDHITLNHEYIDPYITIKQLLNHSSGIEDFGTAEFLNDVLTQPRKIYTPDYCLGKIDTVLFEKGTSHRYSNSNYLLLALIIEQVTQKPLEIALTDLLLKPDKLDSTYPYFSREIKGMAHPMFNKVDFFGWQPFSKAINDVSLGDGNFVTSAYGLFRFYDLLLRKRTILQPESLKQMKDFEKGKRDEEYGCGIFRNVIGGKELLYHTGRQVSYIATCVYVPAEDKILVVLTNNMDDEYADLVVNKLLGVKFY